MCVAAHDDGAVNVVDSARVAVGCRSAMATRRRSEQSDYKRKDNANNGNYIDVEICGSGRCYLALVVNCFSLNCWASAAWLHRASLSLANLACRRVVLASGGGGILVLEEHLG